MDIRKFKRILKEFENSSISKLEITDKDLTIKLEKNNSDTNQKNEIISTPQVENPVLEVESKIEGFTLESPLVGTFYDSPSPDSKPFVSVNQQVEKGQVVFIIEAMKVMNEIKSPVSGVIKKIYPLNGEALEYGQKVMVIKE
jgi:acetyl-CoA carboxylase biotin carboxyl carrier protein